MNRKLLDDALDYAARGWSVFPCLYRAKEPAVPRGFYSATTNPATIKRWFGGTVNYNLAVRTGLASEAWVLDVDDRHGGFASLGELEHLHGPLPLTRQVRTADGLHFWWKATGPIQCSDDRVAQGLGTKGDGGYAIVPPSVHPDGPIYTWINDEPLAVAPDWLIKLTQKPPPKISERATSSVRPGAGPSAYGRAALKAEIAELASTPEGSRNHRLNYAAFCLFQLVAGGELDGGEVEQRLVAAADANGLLADDGMRQVLATIRSGQRAGLLNPRGRP